MNKIHRQIFKLAAILTIIFNHSLAFAETTVDEPLIAPLKRGQQAPWPGVLLNAAAVGSIKFDKENEKEKIDTEVQKAVSDVLTRKNGELDILKVSLEGKIEQKDALLEEKEGQLSVFREENKSLREALTNAPNRSTWFGIGLISGILVTFTTVFAVSHVSN